MYRREGKASRPGHATRQCLSKACCSGTYILRTWWKCVRSFGLKRRHSYSHRCMPEAANAMHPSVRPSDLCNYRGSTFEVAFSSSKLSPVWFDIYRLLPRVEKFFLEGASRSARRCCCCMEWYCWIEERLKRTYIRKMFRICVRISLNSLYVTGFHEKSHLHMSSTLKACEHHRKFSGAFQNPKFMEMTK